MNAKKLQIYQQHFEKHIDAPEHIKNQILRKFQEDINLHVELRNDQFLLQKLPPPHKLANYYLYNFGQDFRLNDKQTSPATLFIRGCLTVTILSCLFIYFFFSKAVIPFFEDWGDKVVKKSFDIQIDSTSGHDPNNPEDAQQKNNSSTIIQGEISVATQIQKIIIETHATNLTLKQSSNLTIKWNCQRIDQNNFYQEETNSLKFNIQATSQNDEIKSDCELSLPKDYQININTKASNLRIDKLQNSIKLESDNSNIKFNPHHLGKYKLEQKLNLSNSSIPKDRFQADDYKHNLNFNLTNSNLE